MRGERSVAGFAGHTLVRALALYVLDIAMTAFTDLMARIVDRQRRDLRYSVSAVVPVASEAARHEEGSERQESDQSNQKNRRQAKQMPCMLEHLHAKIPEDLG